MGVDWFDSGGSFSSITLKGEACDKRAAAPRAKLLPSISSWKVINRFKFKNCRNCTNESNLKNKFYVLSNVKRLFII